MSLSKSIRVLRSNESGQLLRARILVIVLGRTQL